MKRQHTYEELIGKKLNGLTPPDVAGLWDNMEAILDREMPQQEKKRRVGTWFLNRNRMLVAGLLITVGSVYTLCHVSGKEPVALTVSEVADPVAAISESSKRIEKTSGQQPFEHTTALSEQEKSNGLAGKSIGVESSFAQQPVRTTGVVTAMAEESLIEMEPAVSVEQSNVDNDFIAPIAEAENSAPFAESLSASTTVESAGENSLTAPVKEGTPVKIAVPAIFQQQNINAFTGMATAKKTKTNSYSDKGLAVGFSLNLPVALNQQQKNQLDMQGQKNQWQDYVPSVYAQLHLNKKFYLQAEWQPLAAQYTPGFTLYNRTDVLNPDEKEQKVVKLNKLFYTNLPLSLHYNTLLKNVTLGLGVQYSKLKKIILQDQEYYHLIQAGGVFNVDEHKNEVVAKDPEDVRSHSTGDVVDSVARSFRREEWRLLADASYRYKSFHVGVRYTQGMQNYLNTNFSNLPVKDRNESLQVYLRCNLFDSRKK